MGLTKVEIFTAEQNELAAIAKVLGHPARVAIIQHLLKVNSCIGREIVEEIELAQPTISRHLRELKSVGLIQGTIEGTRLNYCINGKKWREVQSLLNGLFDAYVADRDCEC